MGLAACVNAAQQDATATTKGLMNERIGDSSFLCFLLFIVHAKRRSG
ncbi:hypothetical protein O59_001142 [Cellvibrio sp. BR]|nr:hypothetical protein O59_001142 [Cellvibrio sp. BR]